MYNSSNLTTSARNVYSPLKRYKKYNNRFRIVRSELHSNTDFHIFSRPQCRITKAIATLDVFSLDLFDDAACFCLKTLSLVYIYDPVINFPPLQWRHSNKKVAHEK